MPSITFKGARGRLIFLFQPGYDFPEYTAELRRSFAENPQLFSDSRVQFAGSGLKALSAPELQQIQQICLNKGLLLDNLYTESPVPEPPPAAPAAADSSVRSDGVTISRTLRSGQKCISDGTLVVYGNVNESAEVMAKGDIIVLGRLEGIAHAGCEGNEGCFIFALSLNARQIRIASHVSRAGEGEVAGSEYPEVAFIENGSIEIKPYDARTLF